MRKLLWLVALLPALAWGQYYTATVEAGDTLISNTVDTTDACLIYNTTPNDRRPVRPTLYIDVDEIGTNTTHYWLEIAIDIASSEKRPGKSDDRWFPIYRRFYNDWFGLGGSGQGNISIPLPQIEAFGFSYFRVRLSYPYGVAADSSGYAVYIGSDENNSMYSPSKTTYRTVSHYELFGTNTSKLVSQSSGVASSYVFDLPIETFPGQFEIPSRGVVNILMDDQYDDDSITVFVQGYKGLGYTESYIDTLTIGGLGGLNYYSSGVLSLTTGFINAIRFTIQCENNAAADTDEIWMTVHLECNP